MAMSQDQFRAVSRNIFALPKLLLRMIWKLIKLSIGSLRNITKLQQRYDFWVTQLCLHALPPRTGFALLVFEPEDQQLLESPAVLKSIELLQLRRNRAARAGRDSTVDMNQSILLGDEELTR
jgi:hypothetical protein